MIEVKRDRIVGGWIVARREEGKRYDTLITCPGDRQTAIARAVDLARSRNEPLAIQGDGRRGFSCPAALPCPCCGRHNPRTGYVGHLELGVRCRKCGLTMAEAMSQPRPPGMTVAELETWILAKVVRRWNRRAAAAGG